VAENTNDMSSNPDRELVHAGGGGRFLQRCHPRVTAEWSPELNANAMRLRQRAGRLPQSEIRPSETSVWPKCRVAHRRITAKETRNCDRFTYHSCFFGDRRWA
jgi:hypothetical protein